MQLAGLGLRHVADDQQGIQLDHRAAGSADGQVAADLGVAVVEHAGEGRANIGLLQGDLRLAHAGRGVVQGGLGLKQLGRGAEALLGQVRRGVLGELGGLLHGAGLGEARLAGVDVQAAEHLTLAHHRALQDRCSGHRAGGFRPDQDGAGRRGAAADHHRIGMLRLRGEDDLDAEGGVGGRRWRGVGLGVLAAVQDSRAHEVQENDAGHSQSKYM